MNKHQGCLEDALSYAEKKRPVFPLHAMNETGCTCGKPDCNSIAKHPRTKNGLTDATTDEAKIREWWTRWPDANIGIRTGKESGLVVVDIDSYKGGDDIWDEICRGHDPIDTVEVLTGGGGRHLYLQHPGDREIKSCNGKHPGIDIKADGGYVVAPGSIHKSGREYMWEMSSTPDDVGIADIPDWLQEIIGAAIPDALPQQPDAQASPEDEKAPIPVSADDQTVILEAIERVSGKITRKSNGEYWARCPHPDHEDHDPSFSVNFDKSVFKCFGCDWSGTVRALAHHLGVRLNRSRPEESECDSAVAVESPQPEEKHCADYASAAVASPVVPYRATDHGLVWIKREKDRETHVPLTNFTACITRDIVHDDGVEQTREMELQIGFRGRQATFSLSAGRYNSMMWPIEHIGAGAIIYPGQALKDRTRVAIQSLSGDIPVHTHYTHLGWHRIDDRWTYLHADGGIGSAGPVPDVAVSLPGTLSRFVLPPVSDEIALCGAVRASLDMLQAGDIATTLPLYAIIWRTILGDVDFSGHLSGPSGAGKTAMATLVQQHWGAGLNVRNLPGSWSSTGNANEGLAFILKDTVCVVDDFAPTGSSTDVRRYHRDADRFLRAQGNHSGRLRMRPDGTLRQAKPPRGCVLSTGEDIPSGYSLRARILIIEMDQSTLDWEAVTRCQQAAAEGRYAVAMSGFVQWVAGRYDRIQEELQDRITGYRDKALGSHRRTPTMAANLMVGLDAFLEFAVDTGVYTDAEAEDQRDIWWRILMDTADMQAQYHEASEPVQCFLELLTAALSSGHAYVSGEKSGDTPNNPGAWGWRDDGSGNLHPRGDQIGWIIDEDLYLEPGAAYRVAREMVGSSGDGITIALRTLQKRMHEQGLLKTTEQESRGTYTVRKQIQGARRSVLHLSSHRVIETNRQDHLRLHQPDVEEQPASNGHSMKLETAIA